MDDSVVVGVSSVQHGIRYVSSVIEIVDVKWCAISVESVKFCHFVEWMVESSVSYHL